MGVAIILLPLLGTGCNSTQTMKVKDSQAITASAPSSTPEVSKNDLPPSEKDLIQGLADEYRATPNWGATAIYSNDIATLIASNGRAVFSADLDDIFTENKSQYIALTMNDAEKPWKIELKATAEQIKKLATLHLEQQAKDYPSPHRFVFVASVKSVEKRARVDEFGSMLILGSLIAIEPSGNTDQASFTPLF